MKKQVSKEEYNTILARTADLLAELVGELRIRGVGDGHGLILRSRELIPLIQGMQDQIPDSPPDTQAPSQNPQKLHQMSAISVTRLELSSLTGLTEQGLVSHSLDDLIEAAFTFENQLMAILEDDNFISVDAYAGLSEQQLLQIIESAVEKICRQQRGTPSI